MKVAYLHGMDTTKVTGGGAVHARGMARAMARSGVNLMTLGGGSDPDADWFPNTRWGRLRMALSADLYYIRVHGSPRHERYGERKIARWLAKPVVWELNAPLDELAVQSGMSRNRIDALEAERRSAAGRVAAATCVSPELEKYAASLGIPQTVYVPNGSDPALFSPERRSPAAFAGRPGRFTVLWAGSTKFRWQGWDIVAKLAEAVSSLDPEILFVAVGTTDRTGWPDFPNLMLLPPRDHERMPELMASADACLCLYHPCEWSSIGFYFSPLKLFDYMASGRAVIGTNLGEIGRVIQDGRNGLLTRNDIPELVHLVMRLRDDAALRARLGAAAREDVIRFYNWDRAAGQTIDLFRKVLDHRS